MLVLMAVLFGAKYFSVQADSRVIAGSSNASDLAIESLSSKIVSRNQEHQRLQWKRAALSDSPKQPTSTLAPGERTRRALVSELIHLLALEKQYSEGSPEIASTREQIDALQAQIADLPQVDQHAQFARASTDASQLELAQVDQQLSLNEAATKADIAELGVLVRARELTDAPRQSPRTGLGTFSIVTICLFVGLAVALLLVLLARHQSVRDEATLRSLLPQSITFIGAVPHMRGSL